MTFPSRLLPLGWLLAACASAPPAPSLPPAPAPPAAAAPAETKGPIDLQAIDRSTLPGDDFFKYANGKWIAATQIPPDRSAWGVTGELEERLWTQIRELLEGAARSISDPGSLQRMVGDFYASAVDEAAVEAKGLAPLRPALARVGAVKSRADLATYLGEELRADVDAMDCTQFHTTRLLGLWVAPDPEAPARNTPFLLQGGLGLPDREYYLSDEPEMAATRARYRAHVEAVLRLAGLQDTARRAEGVLDLETKIARAHATRRESVEVKMARAWPPTEWVRQAPGLDWARFFKAAGLDQQRIVAAWHPKAIAGLAALVAREPLARWKDWATFQAIDRRAPYLTRAFQDEEFAFHGRVLRGATEQGPRWKRARGWLDLLVGEAVGRLYVERHFTPKTREQVEVMVKSIKEAFLHRIDALDWMAPSTKAQAMAKLESLYVGVGYPEHWQDWSGLRIDRGDLLGNVERAERYRLQQRLAALSRPVDRTEWCMLPHVVDAVNMPARNALSFPAGILQPPFYDPDASAAFNYGSTGSVIGHEISHSFDDQGSLFDSTGRLRNWWTKEDLARFEQSGAQLAAQFDAYQPLPGLHVNGKQTLSENIADLAGLSAAYDGWRTSVGRKSAPVVQGLSGDQQFFLAYAQSWRNKYREPVLREIVVSDGHAPDSFRAETVRNLDAWYPAFDVKPGQALYLAPGDRVRVW